MGFEGMSVLRQATRDTRILIAQRFVRNFGYGCTLLIFVLFFTGLRYSETATGIFMTLTILGDLLISMLLTVVADRVGRRRTLAIGAAGVILSGLAFATCGNYWILLGCSIIGVLTPTGNEIGPFKAIEESTISQLVTMKDRPHILAWYYSLGTFGFAIGTLVGGFLVESLQESGISPMSSYRIVFWLYTLLGVVKFVLSLMLSPACELAADPTSPKMHEQTRTLVNEAHLEEAKLPKVQSSILTKMRSFVPQFEGESRSFIMKFAIIFFIDQVANGSMPFSFLAYYWKRRWSLSDDTNGAIFFGFTLLAAASNMVAGSLTKRIGAVPTMLLSHFPCSISAALIPLPSNIWLASLFLTLRWALVDMNQVPRQALIASALKVRFPAVRICDVDSNYNAA